MSHCCTAVLRPLPVGAAIERVGEGANFLLVRRLRIEIKPRRQRAREQKRAVYRRKLALPGAATALHIEEMVIETPVAGRVRFGALRTVPEKTQRRQRPLDCGGTRHESAFDPHRIRRQRQAGGRNAGRPIWRRLVDHQSVGGIGLMHKVVE